jgi:hypothetical protein
MESALEHSTAPDRAAALGFRFGKSINGQKNAFKSGFRGFSGRSEIPYGDAAGSVNGLGLSD